MDVKQCLDEGFLIRIQRDPILIEKEFNEAEYDLNRSKRAFEENDFKWCIIKGYFSMFHAARAVLFSLGYRERRHFAIKVVLEDLVKKGKLKNIYLEYYSSAMSSRENADYRYTYFKENAEDVLVNAQKFLNRMRKLIE